MGDFKVFFGPFFQLQAFRPVLGISGVSFAHKKRVHLSGSKSFDIQAAKIKPRHIEAYFFYIHTLTLKFFRLAPNFMHLIFIYINDFGFDQQIV